ncbi:MAG: hypothetical protein HY457_01225 [Parcubacteria group bacterium]|nr:hypothetical protein [Parcubacteria group bacterium]
MIPGDSFIGNEGQIPTYVETVEETLREKGTSEEEIDRVTKTSIFGEKVGFERASGASQTDPQKEYILIRASYQNKEPVTITGWQVKSILTGNVAAIGTAAYLPQPGMVNASQLVALAPGGKAYLVTGSSPIGASFRINSCIGYYEQFQDFLPPLPSECPHPKDDFQNSGTTSDGQCLDYLETLNQCEAHVQAIPLSMTGNPVCQDFISQYVSYGGCVTLHKNETDFYKNEWRIYFGRGQELWRDKRELLVLYDAQGRIVDSIAP